MRYYTSTPPSLKHALSTRCAGDFRRALRFEAVSVHIEKLSTERAAFYCNLAW